MTIERAVCGLLLVVCVCSVVGAGPLDPPPGPVAPTLKTLDQVRPGTPIDSLPYTITASGVYYLTADQVFAGADNAITVAAADVTLDLAGFAITGPGRDSSINGVQNLGGASLRLINGTISGFTIGVNSTARGGRFTGLTVRDCAFGLYVVASSISDCHALENSKVGITTLSSLVFIPGDGGFNASGAALVEHCTATANAEAGFSLADGTTISDSVATRNKRSGIGAASSCRVHRCTVIGTLADASEGFDGRGIELGNGSSASECTVSDCQTGGIYLNGDNVQVTRCTVTNNGGLGIGGSGSFLPNGFNMGNNCTITDCHVARHAASPGYGITVRANSTVMRNTVHGSLRAGIIMSGSRNTIAQNQLHNNGQPEAFVTTLGGIVAIGSYNNIDSNTCLNSPTYGIALISGSNTVIRNICGGNAAGNFSGLAGNIHGVVIDRTASTAPITSSDPSSNISY